MIVKSEFYTKQDILDFMHTQKIEWHGTLASDETSIAKFLGSSPYVVLTDCTHSVTPNWHEDLYVMMGDVQFKICKSVDCKFSNVDFTTIDLTKHWVWFLVKRYKKPYAEYVNNFCKVRKAKMRKKFLEHEAVTENEKQLFLASHTYYSELQILVLPFLKENNLNLQH